MLEWCQAGMHQWEGYETVGRSPKIPIEAVLIVGCSSTHSLQSMCSSWDVVCMRCRGALQFSKQSTGTAYHPCLCSL